MYPSFYRISRPPPAYRLSRPTSWFQDERRSRHVRASIYNDQVFQQEFFTDPSDPFSGSHELILNPIDANKDDYENPYKVSQETLEIPYEGQEEFHIRFDEDVTAPKPAEDVTADNFKAGWRLHLAFAALSVVTLMAAVDATSLSVALPIMSRLLNGTAIEAFWAGTSFLLTCTVFQPVIGSFSHIFGRKPVLYVVFVFFGVGSIVIAVAKNFTIILLGRSIQGIGGGGLIALTEIIVTDLIPLRLRGEWFSIIHTVYCVGTVLGPIVGGGFAQNVNWTWIFWINLPLLAFAAVLVFFFLQLNFKTTTFFDKLSRIDWIGTVIFIASTTGFLIPLSWGGTQYPWTSWRTLVPLIVSLAGLVGFVVYEEKVAKEPLIRMSIFKNRTSAVSFLGTFLHGVALYAILYYMPLYFEAVKGFSPIITGVAMFPQMFTVSPAAIASGVYSAVTGRYVEAIWLGWVFTCAGMGILILLREGTSTVAWIFINLVSGLGIGILFTVLSMAIQASTPNKDMGYAVTMFAFFRALGQTVGVAVGGVIFQNRMLVELQSYPLLADRAHEYARDSSSLAGTIKTMEDGLEKDQLKASYVKALMWVWIVMCALSGVGLLTSLFTKALPLDRALETDQGFAHQEVKNDEEMHKRGGD
ncbi:MFS general substrate transporter [Eremomyces bilateralis CBS 781.70]|uniref:MFS general substrate transporter n=1 Tax=Eremomyces bilateralis CBS 781.70 TaxID=1392243 RepID=A0A6G1G6J8_9PEZI|nr:MFS general substrate transporter [Eremomyces bilateralis CBS 781.70]KAF1813715.1 MFS general substrate transporter [Eremomyces bilateralis CBS 781.70]